MSTIGKLSVSDIYEKRMIKCKKKLKIKNPISFSRLMDDATKPMTILLSQEIDRIQNVLELVKSTLEDLLLAIDGIIIMDEVKPRSTCIFNRNHVEISI